MVKKKETEVVVVKELPIVQPKPLVLEGDPEQQLAFAMKAANALMKAVNQKPKKVMIRGEQYLEYGDWQTLARFFGATASIEWSKPLLDEKGDVKGYEARSAVLHQGVVISSAEAMCLRGERNWRDRDEFMLRSMAQTRAAAKALRNAYGWVAELAGMKSTPAEEMGEVYDTSKVPDKAIPTVVYDTGEEHYDQAVDSHPKIVAPKVGVDIQRRKIKDLADSVVQVPLEGAQEYKDWVKSQTGLELEAENYKEIIIRLEALTK